MLYIYSGYALHYSPCPHRARNWTHDLIYIRQSLYNSYLLPSRYILLNRISLLKNSNKHLLIQSIQYFIGLNSFSFDKNNLSEFRISGLKCFYQIIRCCSDWLPLQLTCLPSLVDFSTFSSLWVSSDLFTVCHWKFLFWSNLFGVL